MEQMKNKLGSKRKVKGMMGLAIQHGADVADPVQLNPIDQNFDEDDILGDGNVESKPGKKKVKGDDDFGMSSDEEKQLEKRKLAKKKKSIQ